MRWIDPDVEVVVVPVSSLWSALVVVFVAELGDKTQLVALGFGARYRLGWVLTGIGLGGAYGIYMGFSVVSIFFVAKFVHETKGRDLEEMKG